MTPLQYIFFSVKKLSSFKSNNIFQIITKLYIAFQSNSSLSLVFSPLSEYFSDVFQSYPSDFPKEYKSIINLKFFLKTKRKCPQGSQRFHHKTQQSMTLSKKKNMKWKSQLKIFQAIYRKLSKRRNYFPTVISINNFKYFRETIS